MESTPMQDQVASNSNPSSNPIYHRSSLTSFVTDSSIVSFGGGNSNGASSGTSVTDRGGDKNGSSGGGRGGDLQGMCRSCGSKKVDELDMFPPGYKFEPTDEELIVHYLRRKIDKQPLPPNKIHDLDIYAYEPKMLLGMYKTPAGEHCYFFTPRKKKYRNGRRPNRAAGKGYWKASGADTGIFFNGVKVGFKRDLVFYMGKPPDGVKTNWMMKEYRVPNPPAINPNPSDSMRLDDSILCRIYMKKKKDKTRTPTPKTRTPTPKTRTPTRGQNTEIGSPEVGSEDFSKGDSGIQLMQTNCSNNCNVNMEPSCRNYQALSNPHHFDYSHDRRHPHHHQSTASTRLDFPYWHRHPATITNHTGFNRPSQAVNNITGPPQPSPSPAYNSIPVSIFQMKGLGLNSSHPMSPQVWDYDDLRTWVLQPPTGNPCDSSMPFQDYDFVLRDVVSSQPLPLPRQPLIESINPSMVGSSVGSMPLRDYDLIELVSLQRAPQLDESNLSTMIPKMCNNGYARTPMSPHTCSNGNKSNKKHKVGPDQGYNSCGLQVEYSELEQPFVDEDCRLQVEGKYSILEHFSIADIDKVFADTMPALSVADIDKLDNMPSPKI